jgi:hypothetical protein
MKQQEEFWNKLLSSLEKYTWSYLFKTIYNKIIGVNYFILVKNFFKRTILLFLDLFDDLKRKDHLWIKARKRLFFTKVKHFVIIVFSSYYSVSYLYDIFERRNWLAEDRKRPYEYNPYNFTVKEWDNAMIDAFAGYNYYYEVMKIPDNIFDMWYHMALYIFMLNLFYFSSFFFRSVHEVFYNRDCWTAIIIFSGCFLYLNNWFFGEICLGYLYTYSYIPFWFLYLGTYLIFNYFQWRYEDEEEYLESWSNRVFFQLNKLPDLMGLPEITKYDGSLHKLPNIYTVDPDTEVTQLIFERKRRYADVQPGGIYYQLYHNTFWSYDYSRDLFENIGDNIKKTFRYFWLDMHVEPMVETFYEFLHRYYKETGVLMSGDSDAARQKREVIILPWNHKKRLKGKTPQQLFLYNFWTRDSIPIFIRWAYLFVWFYFEYRETKYYLKKKKVYKRIKTLFFWRSLKRFFGFKVKDDSNFFKFTDGYVIKVKGLPRVFFKNDPGFDINLYNRPEVQYESIPIQIKNLFLNIYINFVYFFKTFFGSSSFWISVLFFWRDYSPVRVFSRWFFGQIILHYILVVLEFILLIPYRIYKTFDICIYLIYSAFKFYYILNILYWSFLLNLLYWFKVVFHVLFKRTRPVGPFRYYNASPWRQYKVENFWKGFYWLFRKNRNKVFNLTSKESFLIWSKKKNNK